jgi:hypothetical protein
MNIRTTASCLSMFVCSSLLIKSLYESNWELLTVSIFSLTLAIYLYVLNKRHTQEYKADSTMIDDYHSNHNYNNHSNSYYVNRKFDNTED